MGKRQCRHEEVAEAASSWEGDSGGGVMRKRKWQRRHEKMVAASCGCDLDATWMRMGCDLDAYGMRLGC